MSNARYRQSEAAPEEQPSRMSPLQAMSLCNRDPRLFALYIEFGGAEIDRRIAYFTEVMKAARESLPRSMALEREAWARREQDPEHRMRPARGVVSINEVLRCSKALTQAMEERRDLMLRVLEASVGGVEAREMFLKRARRAMEAVEQGQCDMPLACEEVPPMPPPAEVKVEPRQSRQELASAPAPKRSVNATPAPVAVS